MKLSRFVIAAIGVFVSTAAVKAAVHPVIPPPPPPPGTVVDGVVRLPSGLLAENRSLLERFAALLIQEAKALTSMNVRSVGRNVAVRLSLRRGDGAEQALDTSYTNDQGQFLMYLPSGTSADTCRFMLSVGNGPTLTRAFVDSTTEPTIIDYASETAVTLTLGQVAQGADLCGFSAGEIRSLVSCVRNLPGDVTGANVFETNHNALLLAANAIAQSGGQCLGSATPVATVTPTRTPPPPTACAPIPCGGDCAVPAPCTPGTACPQYVVKGTCEVVSNACACVANPLTPVPTPTRTPNSSGLCGDVCDGQPCGGAQCPGGGPLQTRRCTVPTTHGCECEPLECPAATPTPLPTLPCVGDCNGEGVVTVDEIVRLVTIALNGEPYANACSGSEQWCNSGPVVGAIGITCLIDAVNNLLHGCPAALPTASPTPTPTVAIHYRLVAGSTILSSPAPPGSHGATLREPLSGTFVAVPLPYGGQYCLNTILCFGVTTFHFQSSLLNVIPSPGPYQGFSGVIYETTFTPDDVFVGFGSSVNGQPFILSGDGAFDSGSPYPPTFSAIEICATPPGVGGSCAGIRAGTDVGYDIIIFAVPEG